MLPHVENVNFAWENHKRKGPGDNQDIAFPCFPQAPNVKISTAHCGFPEQHPCTN